MQIDTSKLNTIGSIQANSLELIKVDTQFSDWPVLIQFLDKSHAKHRAQKATH